MIKYIIFATMLLFACKPNSGANTPTNISIENEDDEQKDPENNPIMGGPTDIKITLSDPNKSGTARIIGFYSDQNFVIDTITYSKGVMQYKNAKGLPQGYYYFAFSENEILQLILDKDQEFEIKVNFTDITNSIEINGSEDNSLMYEVTKYEQKINPQITAISEKMKAVKAGTDEYEKLKSERSNLEDQKLNYLKGILNKNPTSLFANFKYGGQNPKVKENLSKEAQFVHYRKEFWDNVNFNDRRLLRTPMIGNKMKRYFTELTPQNHDSVFVASKNLMDKVMDKNEYFKVFANWIVIKFEPTKCALMDAESVYVNMVQNYFTRERAFWADTLTVAAIQQRAREMSASLIGKNAPNVISTDPNGKKQELLAKKADYLIVYLYNPDCEHCMEETPKLLKYYNENKDNNKLDVYAIALDTEDAKWKNYIKKLGLSWTNVYDPTNKSIYAKYFVDITPEIYVINKERKIIGKNLKTFQIQEVINKDKEQKK
ncbi:MAG: redoxin domain-containing protein [Saprospiraceae bacterium]|nr:redoxin domain-containing protein [Saprospiraceae bacterium]